MVDTAYRAPDGFVTMKDAQDTLAVSSATLQRLVKRLELTVYNDPRNKRVRLLKVEDLEHLSRPVPERR